MYRKCMIDLLIANDFDIKDFEGSKLMLQLDEKKLNKKLKGISKFNMIGIVSYSIKNNGLSLLYFNIRSCF